MDDHSSWMMRFAATTTQRGLPPTIALGIALHPELHESLGV